MANCEHSTLTAASAGELVWRIFHKKKEFRGSALVGGDGLEPPTYWV